MQLGKGVKQQTVDKGLSRAGGLLDGEEAWAVVRVRNFRPLVDLLVVTNARLLAVASSDGKLGFAAPHPHITAREYDPKKGQVHVISDDGTDMTFKITDRQEGVAMVQHFLEYASTNPAPEAVAAAAELAYTAKEREEQETLERCGREVARDTFALKTVAIYENGYVRVGGAFGLGKSEYEKLIAIESSADITKKTGAGRAAGAVLTGGLNLLSSNKRGDAYLSIVTEVRTHVLHEESPTAIAMKSIKKLEGAGNGVLNAQARAMNRQPAQPFDAPAVQETPSTQDAGERLNSLVGLRDQGLISDEEYETLRAKILESL